MSVVPRLVKTSILLARNTIMAVAQPQSASLLTANWRSPFAIPRRSQARASHLPNRFARSDRGSRCAAHGSFLAVRYSAVLGWRLESRSRPTHGASLIPRATMARWLASSPPRQRAPWWLIGTKHERVEYLETEM